MLSLLGKHAESDDERRVHGMVVPLRERGLGRAVEELLGFGPLTPTARSAGQDVQGVRVDEVQPVPACKSQQRSRGAAGVVVARGQRE